MPPSGGVNLGTAQGQVVITANTAQAQAQMQAFAGSMQSIAGQINQIGAALGVNFAVQTAKRLAEVGVAADQAATAYDRQRVAATNLAGSQEQLNSLLAAYDRASGGALDKTTELANVTQLMSVGFADSTQELEQFATAIRGISIATGRSADTITQNLILELFSQRGQRLDQLGLQYDKVRARADELQHSDSSLTQQMAYQQAVLDEALQKFGALAQSAAGQATQVEKLTKAWHDWQLEMSQALKPEIEDAAKNTITALETITKAVEDTKDEIDLLTLAWLNFQKNLPGAGPGLNWLGKSFQDFATGPSVFGEDTALQNWLTKQANPLPSLLPSAANQSGNMPFTPFVPSQRATTGFSDDATAAIVEHAHKQLQLEQQTNQALNDENSSYQEQRLRIQTNYDEQVARSASDFAKQQIRQEEDYQKSIADLKQQAAQRDALAARDHDQQIARMQRDSGEQLANLAEDRDRTIAQRRADFDDRIGKLQIEHATDIAQKQEDSTKRLLQIDQDFNRQREQAQLSHQNTLSDAAARLDAFAVFAEQQRFATEQKAAQQDHDQKVKDEQDKLQESIDNANAAYDQKVADEKASLDKAISQANDSYERQAADQQAALAQRISDANEAYAQQLSDAHAADDQRLSDMADNFTEQKNRQIADQAERMSQMATDHTAELTEFDTEHGKRITQIQTHAGEELTALDTAFNDQMTQLGNQNDAWKKAQDAFQTFSLNSYKDHLNDMQREGINAEIRELKSALLNPLTDPTQLQSINNAITALGQALAQIPARTGTDNAPNTPQITQDDGGNTPVVRASGIVSAASVTLPASAQVTATGNNTAVTIAAGAVVINGLSDQTATDLAGIIDQRIYNAVLKATGRG